MKTRAEIQHELYEKFKELEHCKVFALNRVMRKFYSIPLEIEDLEFIAWKAFLESEEKFNEKEHRKSYENFYRDCLYWRAKDYCMKYSTQKHRAINMANQIDWSTEYKTYVDETEEQKILDKLAIKAYIEINQNNDKGKIAKMFMFSYPINDMCQEINVSKSRLYRILDDVKKDLGQILVSNYED